MVLDKTSMALSLILYFNKSAILQGYTKSVWEFPCTYKSAVLQILLLSSLKN